MVSRLPEIAFRVAKLQPDWHKTGWSRAVSEAGLVQRQYAWCDGIEPVVDHDGPNVARVQFDLCVYWQDEDGESPGYEALEEHLTGEFNLAVTIASIALGKPTFCGTGDHPDYPEAASSDPLAIWELSTSRVLVEVLDREDDDDPRILAIAVEPAARKRDGFRR